MWTGALVIAKIFVRLLIRSGGDLAPYQMLSTRNNENIKEIINCFLGMCFFGEGSIYFIQGIKN